MDHEALTNLYYESVLKNLESFAWRFGLDVYGAIEKAIKLTRFVDGILLGPNDEPIKNPGAWIHVSAYNNLRNQLTKARRLRQKDQEYSDEQRHLHTSSLSNCGDQFRDPEYRKLQCSVVIETLIEFVERCEAATGYQRELALRRKEAFERLYFFRRDSEDVGVLGQIAKSLGYSVKTLKDDVGTFQTEFWSIRDNRDVHGTRFQTDNNRNKRPAKDEFRLLKNPPVSDNARNAAGHMPEAEKKDYDDVFDWVVRYTDAMCPSKERLQEYRCSLPDDRLGIGLRDVHFHVVERDCPFCMERLGMIDSPDIPNEKS